MQEKLVCRWAVSGDIDHIKKMYYDVIDVMPQTVYFDWEKGRWPSDEYLVSSIENKELYIGESGGEIVCAAILNHEYNEGYDEAPWQIDADENDTLMVHTLAVSPYYHGKGISVQFVRSIIEAAREKSLRAVRLDIIVGNVAAGKLYEKCGFKFIQHFVSRVKIEEVYFFEYVL